MYFYRMCVFLVFSSGLIWSLPAYSLELPRCDKYFNFDALSQGNPDHAFFIDVHIPNELHDVIYRIIPMTPSLNYEELKIHYPYPDTIGYRLSCLYHSNGVLKQITDSVYRINIVPTVGYDEDGNEVYSEDAGFTMTPEEWLSQFEVVMKERYGIDIWHTDAVLSGMASKTIRIEYTDEPRYFSA